MAADLLDERHDCGADTLQGAEYTSDGTPCVLQMKAKCAGDAVGGTRTSEKISKFLRDTRSGPSTTIKRLSWTPLDDIIRGSAALDALDSKLLRLQKNHAYRPIARKCAGCATAPVGDTSISPVLGDDAGLYTPFEPSDSTPTQKIEQIYQIPHSPSEPTTSNDRLPTKAPKTTNAPEHGTVNATEPSKATACKGAPGDPTKSGSICQSTDCLPSETIFIAPQQGTKSSIPTPQTKERPTQPLDAHGFPDICASTNTAGQAVGNDSAGGYSGGSDTPCATPIVHLATDDVWYDCLPTGQDILDEDPTASYSTKFGHADAGETSAKDRFLDGGASRDTPRICIPSSVDGKASPESPASMYYTPEEVLHPSSPTISEATTLVDTLDFGKSLSRSNSTEIQCMDPQIHDNKVSEAPVVVSATRGRKHLATAADLPEDLFDQIIHSIIEITVWGGLGSTESNRYIGSCALTCRYWAKKLRAWNFGDMRVSSARQIKNLDALLSAPPITTLEPVAALIRHLKIVYNGSGDSWLHCVTHLITKHPLLANDIRLDLELDQYGLATRGQPFRSIFFYLPRTLPFLYHKFIKLTLKNTHFATSQDLFAVLAEFKNLRYLRLISVTWSIPSLLQIPPPAIPESLDGIHIEPSSGDAAEGDGIVPWMLAASIGFTSVGHPKNQALGVWPYKTVDSAKHVRSLLPPTAPSEISTALRIVEAFYPPGLSSPHTPGDKLFWSISRYHPHDDTKHMEIKIRAMLHTPSCPLAVAPAIVLRLQHPDPIRRLSKTPPPKSLHIRGIYLNFALLQRYSTQTLLDDMNWRQFFSSTSTLAHLREAEIHVKSGEQREEFVERHVAVLSELIEEGAGRTTCRYRYQLGTSNLSDPSSADDYIISTMD